jgi:shikimate kinase
MTTIERVFIVGLRGAGKTTVGRLLAANWECSFLDADQELEMRTGTSIAAIIAQDGMTGFRDRETDILRELAQRCRHVIATGGGCVERQENRELLRAGGRTVWLTAVPETLWHRVQADPQTPGRRPALTRLSSLDEMRRLAEQREPWYREVADLTIATDGQSPEQVAATIVRAWPSL